MFWKFLIVLAAMIGLLQLGALSVWVVVLKAAVIGLTVLALVMGGLFAWRYLSKRA